MPRTLRIAARRRQEPTPRPASKRESRATPRRLVSVGTNRGTAREECSSLSRPRPAWLRPKIDGQPCALAVPRYHRSMPPQARPTPGALRIELAGYLNDADGTALCEVSESPSAGVGNDDRARLARYLRAHLAIDLDPTFVRDLDLQTARQVMAQMFCGPAWGPSRRTPAEALKTARRFEAFFDSPRLYSTYTYEIEPARNRWLSTGRHLLGHSYEVGLFAADDHRVGVLWFGDED